MTTGLEYIRHSFWWKNIQFITLPYALAGYEKILIRNRKLAMFGLLIKIVSSVNPLNVFY